MDPAADYAAAAEWACGAIEAIPAGAWDGPGLGEWDLRALVGHTSRALITVQQYLARPAETEAVPSAEAYFAATSAIPGAGADEVRERGVAAGAALGEQPAVRFREIAEETLALLSGAGDPLIETIAGGMRFRAYLRTRTFELVVHGLDVCGAVRLPQAPPEGPLRDALRIASGLAIERGTGSRLLLALTGRGSLPPAYSVLDPAPDRDSREEAR